MALGIGLLIFFAAIPIIVHINWVYDDNVLPGTVVSIIMAPVDIELGKKDGPETGSPKAPKT